MLQRAELLREASFIDGQWVAAHALPEGLGLKVFNPSTGQVLGSVPSLSAEHATGAVDAASRAFRHWRKLTGKDRAAILRRWFDLVVEHTEDLARLLSAEQGKPLAEARAEIAYAASYIEWYGEEAKRVYGDTIPGHQADKRLLVLKQPVGVVAAITPWNFPAAMVTRKVAPALAVGCTVILKPSELTPFSALALGSLGAEAGIPPGVFNIITGEPEAIGEVLTSDPRIRKFTFTGSTAVGKRLAARCMSTVKRVSLELGGNAPFIIFDDADIDRAIEGALASKFRNGGQTCVCANRFLVHERIHDQFVERLASRTAALQIGPLINESALQKIELYVSDAVARGARLLTGGSRVRADGLFYAPTVLSNITPSMLLFREEIFGPVAAVVSFSTEQEAIDLANDTAAGLASYVYTKDTHRIWRLAEALEFGMVGINTGSISTEVAPFGGIKESGLGREGSYHGAHEFLDVKFVLQELSQQ